MTDTLPEYLTPRVEAHHYAEARPLPSRFADRPGVAEAFAEHERVLAIFRDARTRHTAVAGASAQAAARESDRAALEAAMRTGAEDPGTPAMDALEEQAKGTHRRACGARDALATAYRDAFAVLRGPAAEEWLSAVERDRVQAQKDLIKAPLDEVLDVVERIDALDAEADWAAEAIRYARGDASLPPLSAPVPRRRVLLGYHTPEALVDALETYGRDAGTDPFGRFAQGDNGAPLGVA